VGQGVRIPTSETRRDQKERRKESEDYKINFVNGSLERKTLMLIDVAQDISKYHNQNIEIFSLFHHA